MQSLKGVRSELMRHWAVTLLALLLVLRVVAIPVLLASPGPGLMAICAGGQIIYVSMDTMEPVEEADAPPGAACPMIAISSQLAGAQTLLAAPQPAPRMAELPLEFAVWQAAVPCCDYLSRAPPRVI